MTASAPPVDSLLARPTSRDFIRFPDGFGTRFMLVVDTEEEFDWNAPFDRESRAVTAIQGMKRGQDYFARAGVRPLYVTDYPVIDDPVAGAMLAQWAGEGAADVGAHLHPWVNPPHVEEVSAANSFAGNLPQAWEREKLTLLRDRIAQVVGKAPVAFRAGRYGVGPNTGAILRDLGFRLDTSIRSRFNYARQYGPDFTGMPVKPWRAGPERALIELPLSTAWIGPLRGMGDILQPVVERGGIAAGLLARSGLLQRVPLTPEGVSAREAIAAIDVLLADGLPLLMFSFHSPTLEPGHTPYVRDDADLQDFYRWWDNVFGHLARRGVAPASLDDVLAGATDTRQ
tara:strand:+ start:41101 stop:42126 length:1026 start_codon:yes stop_codon:yes gene_type:complete